MNKESKQLSFKDCFALCLFGATVIGLLCFNYWSWAEVKLSKDQQRILTDNMELEISKSNELDDLNTQHRKLAVEYRMLDIDLKQLYRIKCREVADFEPVYRNRIITNVLPGIAMLGLKRKTATVYVPTTGQHRLRIEAKKKKFLRSVPAGLPASNPPYFSKTFPLEPGSTYHIEVELSGSAKSAVIFLDGLELFEVPLKGVASSRHFSSGGSLNRITSSPNQLSDSSKETFSSASFVNDRFLMLPKGASEGDVDFQDLNTYVEVQFFIDSNGPVTGMPDDPMVVRRLMDEFAKGVKPPFTFNSETKLYEFERSDTQQ